MSTTAAELAAFLAHDRAEQIRAGTSLAAEGVALIADISGFTPLTEALARELSAARGAEELTRALNGVFAPLIAQVGRYGGSVIKFAGDALIVWVPRPPRGRRDVTIRRALAAAAGMQAAIERHGRAITPAGPFTLTMKVGMAYGPVLRARLGDPLLGYEDVIGGATLDRMAAAEHRAGPGEILLDPAGVADVATLAAVIEQRDSYLVVAGPRRPVAPARLPRAAAADDNLSAALRPYLPAEVYEAISAGRGQPAELKPVVSIFVQFQGIVYEEGPAAEARLGAYFAAAQAGAARYGGRVNRLLTGDKGSVLHLIFGAPRAVEDLERRAALCLLELRRAAAELGFISAQRIGAAAGRVFAGPVGSPERREYTVMGDTINLSARLMQGAADGQIVVDPALAARLDGEFTLEDLGMAQLKGKAAPVARHALLGQIRRAPRPAARAYGRSLELSALRRQIDWLAHGRGGVALLIGDLGMGKSHLLAALRASADVLWAGATAAGYGQPRSGALIAAALGELLGLTGAADPPGRLGAALGELLGVRAGAAALPYLARFMGLPLDAARERELAALAGESLRWRVFELLGTIVRAACARRPLVLALDDIQWADPTSLELLETLLPLADELPLLIIMASRPDGQVAGGRRQAAGVAPQPLEPASGLRPPGPRLLPPAPLKIELGRLGEAAALAVVAQHAPGLSLAAQARLAARGQGNPLFLVELARTAAQGGDPDELPDSVQGLLLAQIDRLPAELRETLQLASVLGPSFAPRLLAALAGPGAPLDARLAALEHAGFLLRVGEGYDFRHTLIRESAYGAMLYERRRGHHGAAAAAIARLYPTRLAERSGELAEHYERAEELGAAARYHGQAADSARLLYANDEAEAGYRHVLALLDKGGDGEGLRARTYLKLAQVKMNAGDYVAAQELYGRAFGLLGSVKQERHARAATSRSFRLGVYSHGPSTLDPALWELSGDNEVVRDLFEGLVEVDSELNIVPAQALRWRIEDQGRRLVFDLRPNLRWSDGAPLTAHDFAFAIRRNLTPETGSGLAYQLYAIDNAEAYHQGHTTSASSVAVDAADDVTLAISLHEPSPFFLYLLATPISFPQPRHVIAARGKDWSFPEGFVCNGPFYVARWQGRQPHILCSNPYYYGYTPGNLQKIDLCFVKPNQELYDDNKIDWLRIEDRQEISASQQPVELIGYSTYMLWFSCAHPLLARREIRQALAWSIDKPGLVQAAWRNVQIAATGGIIPPSIPGHSPEISPVFDPAAARALILENSINTTRSFVLAARAGFGRVPELLTEAWRAHLGLDVVAVTDKSGAEIFEGLRSGAISMALIGWDFDSPDPDELLRGVFHSASPLNYLSWRNQQFDQLVEQATAESDHQRRMALYHSAERLLVAEDIAVAPLYYHRAYGLLRPGFHLAGNEHILRGDRFRLKQIVVGQR